METYSQQHVVFFNTYLQCNLFTLTAVTGVFERSTPISLWGTIWMQCRLPLQRWFEIQPVLTMTTSALLGVRTV